MDFTFTLEQEALRKDILDFIKKEVPPGIEDNDDSDEAWAFAKAFAKKLAQRRWLTIGWPKEYGGGGYGKIEQQILLETLAYNRALFYSIAHQGITHIGPTIMIIGTEEQKQRFLPRISSGDLIVNNGLSEPEAGSDLAGLKTRAVRQGDEYILNGQKTFQSGGHHADWIRLAVRTDPSLGRHGGISLFMCDLHSPGVTISRQRAIWEGDQMGQSDIFFDDVKVPASNMLGEENKGWYYLMTGLALERGYIAMTAQVQRTFDDFVSFCKEARYNGQPLSKDPLVRYKLAESAADLKAWYHLAWRVIWMCEEEILPNIESGTQWVFGKEARRRFAENAMEIMGMYGQLERGSKWAPLEGRIELLYRWSIESHGGGTGDIIKTVMATRGLGLPR
ncbi:acyl-CoA dehydrogenase family protein [Chloroflexota bacterium]